MLAILGGAPRRLGGPLLSILIGLGSIGASPGSGVAAPAPARGATGAVPRARLEELVWRAVGPANCSGRITDLAAVEKHPATFFLATATGGLFKTTNRGTTWSPLFDKQPVASIGAVAVWQQRPEIVWVGTGEADSRNSSSWGDGIYRSLDGGSTWEHLGLEATRSIARVVLDPADSNTVYVAALGRLWGENAERGVFKTTDGGRSWTQVLEVDSRTGAVDLLMDPTDSRVLYAAMWTRLRTPWSFRSGSRAGGIFRTRDGGRSWTKLTAGLPESTGRIGLDLSRKHPRVLYAVIESDEGGHLSEFEEKSRVGGVFRSVDGGDHWTRLSPYAPRPFYFSQIRVQPDDTTRVYLLGTDLWISDDGGRSFRAGGAQNLHPDCHAMWIDPADGDHVLLGTDGGLFVSDDRARNWDFLNNLALGEFYDVAVDLDDPYHICGGLQDNQSWCGPSRTRLEPEPFLGEPQHNGILNDDWFCLGGGDGFHVAMDPTNPDIVYWESQGGALQRMSLSSGKRRWLRPSNKEGEPSFRFNWNTPFQISPHDPSVLWIGGNHLFRLTERGNRWEMASPDLTTQDPRRMITGGSGAETYCTITALAESPAARGVVWVGTDDGKLWVTPDSGRTWRDLTGRLRGVPAGLYVSCIEASHHDRGTAYVAVEGHRSDDLGVWILVTHDEGQSWTSVAGDLPKGGPVQVVREDPENRNLLFAGTEFGIFMTLDGGRHWQRCGESLPTVAVDDILIHPRERDLVIGTHGRSAYVLDDITPLERWSPAVTADSVTFFPPRAATAYYVRSRSGAWGQRIFSAKNPPFGAYFNYYVKEDIGEKVSIEVADSTGRMIRKLTGPGSPGLHRLVWDLLPGEPWQRIDRPEWSDQPAFVRAGRYLATLAFGTCRPRKQTLQVRVAPGTEDAGF